MKVFNQFLIPIFVGLITVVSVACESQVAPNDRIVDPDILDDEMREDVVLGVDLSSGDELPWFSFIFPKYNTSYQCAGVLIHEHWVLSAAHCLNQTKGYIGFATSYEAMEEKKNQRRCNAWYVHPTYQEWGPDQDILVNDYALCYMSESIENTPIKIDPNFYPTDGEAVVAGFGATDIDGNEWPDAVKKATLPIVANEALSCQEQDRKENICTFDPAGADTCIGDSGGPLYISDEEEDILIGITSYGAVPYERTNLCGDPEFGGVYARVSSGYDWIVETLCKNATTDAPLPAECTYTLPKPKRARCVDNPDFRKKGRDCEDFLSTKRAKRCNRMVTVDGSSTGAAKKSVREECPSFCKQWCRCTDWNHKIPIKIKGNKKRRMLTCDKIKKKNMCDFNTEKRIRGKKLKGKELCPTSCAVDECA